MNNVHTPSATKVGMAATRLPEMMRKRLQHLAQRGYEVCIRYRANTLAQMCDGLALALVALASAEGRCRILARELADAKRRIQELEGRMRSEFDEPTVNRDVNPLIERCR